jgi:cyanate permease
MMLRAAVHRLPARWVALLVLTVARTSLGVQFQSIPSVSPMLVDALGLSYADLGTLIGLYFVPGVVIALPGGALGRRFGDARVVAFGLKLMAGGGLAASLAGGFWGLAAGRLLSGTGGIALNVLMSKMVTDWFSGRRDIVLAMAIFVNSFPIGVGLGTLVLGQLAASAGWQAALAASAISALAALLLLAVGYTRHPNDGAARILRRAVTTAEVLLVSLAGVIWGLYNGAFAVMFGFAPSFFAWQGLAPGEIGLVAGIATLLVALSGQPGGLLALRMRPAALMLAGCLAWASCLVLMASAKGPAAPAILAAGLFMGLPTGVIMALPAQALRPESRALGMGVFYTWLYIGHGAVPPVAGRLQDMTGSAAAPVLLAAALVLALLPLYGLFHWGRAIMGRADKPVLAARRGASRQR